MRSLTVLETVLSLVILSMFIAFVIWSIFWIVERSDYYEIRNRVEEESLFLAQKISWVLDNAEILEPMVNSSSSSSSLLKVNKRNFNQNPIVMQWQGQSIFISYANGPEIILNSEDVTVIGLQFSREVFPVGEKISVSLDLESKTSFRVFGRYQTSVNFSKFLPK